jgi:hypothetical protein
MSSGTHGPVGWWAPNPLFQRESDQLPDAELVVSPPPMTALASDCYPTEGDAWEAIGRYVAAGRNQAQTDVANFTATPPVAGSEPARLLDRQRRRVAYAERVLALCDDRLRALGRS